MTPAELQEALRHFTGTEQYHRYNPLFRNVLLTDGAKFLADEAGAFWLMDAISSHLPSVPKDEHFVVVTLLKYGEGRAANLILADDVPANTVYAHQDIGFTDFPLDKITLYAARSGEQWVVMLTSEY